MSCPPVWSTSAGSANGPHVVLIHGSLDRSAGLLKLSRRLATRCRVTRYDRRGYGRSQPCVGPFGIDAQVADAVDVLAGDAGAARPVVVFGHSYGGNVALALADRHPSLVDAVVTYESPLSWEPWWPDGSAGGDAVAWRHDPAEAAERFMRRLIGDARWERLPPATRVARRAEGAAMIGELADLRARPAWRAERVTVPVLALHGEHGQPHHRLGIERLGEVLPDVEVATVGGARHFGPNTHPDAVAALLADFLAARGLLSPPRRGRS